MLYNIFLLKSMQNGDDDEDVFWKIQLNCHNDQIKRNNDENGSNFFSATSHSGTTWLAPQEREGLNFNRVQVSSTCCRKTAEHNCFEWIYFPLVDNEERSGNENDYSIIENKRTIVQNDLVRQHNNSPLEVEQFHIEIRSMRGNVTLLESHVGEEIWDAARLFSVHLSLAALTGENSKCENLSIAIPIKNKRILELGAGCGLLGLTCYALGASQVLCTDYLPEVMENLVFNLHHNKDKLNIYRNCKNPSDIESWIKCGVLDWCEYIRDDLKDADWMLDGITSSEHYNAVQNNTLIQHDTSSFVPDIIIGSALIYSPQGGISCADVIYTYLKKKKGVPIEVFILQMTERPGFDQFLLRLEYWGVSYTMHDVSEMVHEISKVSMTKESFKWIKIESNSDGKVDRDIRDEV